MADGTESDPFNLSADEAAAKLAEITAAQRGPAPADVPKTASEAKARLDRLTADKKWRENYLNGSISERREFAALTEQIAGGDHIDAILAGDESQIPLIETVTDGELSMRKAMSAADGLRESGLGNAAIREILENKRFSAEQVADAHGWKDRAMRNRDFVTRLLANDADAVREMTVANAIISAGVDETAMMK